MPSPKPLKGIELIDCAQACAKNGLSEAAYQCGYGEDEAEFQAALKEACQEKGIKIDALKDLANLAETSQTEIAPVDFGQF